MARVRSKAGGSPLGSLNLRTEVRLPGSPTELAWSLRAVTGTNWKDQCPPPPFLIHSAPKFAPTCSEQDRDPGSRVVLAVPCPLGAHGLGTVSQHGHTQWAGDSGGCERRGKEAFPAWTIGEVPKPSWVPNHDKQGGCPQEAEGPGQRGLWAS